jgi:hypothetical protein
MNKKFGIIQTLLITIIIIHQIVRQVVTHQHQLVRPDQVNYMFNVTRPLHFIPKLVGLTTVYSMLFISDNYYHQPLLSFQIWLIQ